MGSLGVNGESRRRSFKLVLGRLAGRIFGGDVFGVVSRSRMATELRTDLLPLRKSGSSLAISEGD